MNDSKISYLGMQAILRRTLQLQTNAERLTRPGITETELVEALANIESHAAWLHGMFTSPAAAKEREAYIDYCDAQRGPEC